MTVLPPVAQKFILHWGEMGSRWCVNRTVSQVHALLYLSSKPLTAEEIATTLAVALSNVSTSLRELQAWGIVRVVHVLGDRRDYFESMKDVWEMARVVLHERKQREIDPTLEALRQCMAEAEKAHPPEAYTKERLTEMLEFLETMTSLYDELRRLPTGALRRLAKLRGKLRTLLGAARAGQPRKERIQ